MIASSTTKCAFQSNGRVLIPQSQHRPAAISNIYGSASNQPKMYIASAKSGIARFPAAKMTQSRLSMGPAQPQSTKHFSVASTASNNVYNQIPSISMGMNRPSTCRNNIVPSSLGGAFASVNTPNQALSQSRFMIKEKTRIRTAARVRNTQPITMSESVNPSAQKAGKKTYLSQMVQRGLNQRDVKMQATLTAPVDTERDVLENNIKLGGLNGLALKEGKEFPKSKGEVMQKIPQHLKEPNTAKSLMYAAISTTLTLASGALGLLIPQQWAYAPLWLASGMMTGTIATGCWVVAHECGHFAFSKNRALQDAVGYTLHSALLVPYFSWQRSHAVHHANCNHTELGETHVPTPSFAPSSAKKYRLRRELGDKPFGLMMMVVHLVFGWPVYLFSGKTGGPAYGKTNHFWPYGAGGKVDLFPKSWKQKVLQSDVGIIGVLGALAFWASKTSWRTVGLMYGLPYLAVNFWLVLYTWLQHTDVDVPHFDKKEWTWAKGAFHTIDRPYGPLFNFLHHNIGSTHVAHHVNSSIPHYHAEEVTQILKKEYPDLYLYDPTPIHKALWRVATQCIGVKKMKDREGMYVFQKVNA